jgi:hypothetical protein
MAAVGYSVTCIGPLFYSLLALIGVIIRHFRRNATRRKHFGRPILASVLFTVFAIVSISLLNSWRVIDLQPILNIYTQEQDKLVQNLKNIFSDTTHITDLESSLYSVS